jgi:hypothetical protein
VSGDVTVVLTPGQVYALDLILNGADNARSWAGAQDNEALAEAGLAAAAAIAAAADEHAEPVAELHEWSVRETVSALVVAYSPAEAREYLRSWLVDGDELFRASHPTDIPGWDLVDDAARDENHVVHSETCGCGKVTP